MQTCINRQIDDCLYSALSDSWLEEHRELRELEFRIQNSYINHPAK
jgi:hypothetical protein